MIKQPVGVIGGGQLAWMMAAAAKSMSLDLIVQTPQADDPAASLAKSTILASLDDLNATHQLAQQTQVITFENEFVDLPALQTLADQGVCFRPSLEALAPLLDKYDQRRYLQSLGLPVPKFDRLTLAAVSQLGIPLVVKARRHGYDGLGTFVCRQAEDLERFWQAANAAELWMVEAFVPFERELAIVAARSARGEIVTYPIVETQQVNQVCQRAWIAADMNPTIALHVEQMAKTLLSQLEVVGLWGMELFLTAEGKVLINEIAPRTHNSGHFSLDACVTSQFEQHLRAICDLPLGSVELKAPGAVMVNLLGFETATSDYFEKRQQLAAAFPIAHVHWYGKHQARPGRKLGHVTVLLDQDDRQTAAAVAAKLEQIWYSTGSGA
jgi:5-(carboxyamino)imidazole ribonucleotide synthase